MEPVRALGLITHGWLIGASHPLARIIRRGLELAAELAAGRPETYEALGQHRAGYLQSSRRSRYAQFFARRKYENFGDPAFSSHYDDGRKA